MGHISDIMGLMRKGPELASQFDSIKLNTKSVARGANDATFQFPILISNTIPMSLPRNIRLHQITENMPKKLSLKCTARWAVPS